MKKITALIRTLAAWGYREPVVLGIVLVIAGALWVFAAVADEVMEGETHAIDTAILLAMRNPSNPAVPIGPSWLQEMMRDFTALGGIAVLAFVVAATVGYLLLLRKRRTALMVVLATASGVVVSMALKFGFDRPRPELVPHGSVVYTASFPSGHSMMAAIVYLTLGALVARVQPNRRLKAYLLGLAVTVTFLVGISRIYLGVHWPTDVLAGWAAGAAWALMFWLLAHFLRGRAGD